MDTRAGRAICLAATIALCVLPTATAAPGKANTGSLATAEFPDVVKFDFEKVQASYEKAGENVGKVTSVLDKVLEKGEEAVKAGETARANPTEDNKRCFVAAVMTFVRDAGRGRTNIAGLAEDVRGIHAQTGILYAQATTQSAARIRELRKQFEREELKLKDIVAHNKAKRREKKLSDWELRKLFEEERRQAQVLNRIADRVGFQQDFLKALKKAGEQSRGDFTLYEQFFAEADAALADISDLASNLPVVVERLQIASAMAKNIPSRKAAITGFAKIEKTRTLTKKIAAQLMDICSSELGGSVSEEDGDVKVIMRHTEIYRRWVEGESVQYRRPPKASR